MSASWPSRERLLTGGNTAKLFCLEAIERRVLAAPVGLRVVDLGCGTATNFVELLRRHPGVSYVGVEPDRSACDAARATLAGLNAQIVHGSAYGQPVTPADVVVSFSVLEHVYRRREYIAALGACLKPEGVVYINYDSGHFVPQPDLRRRIRDRAKTLVGGALARTGREGRYQSFVREADFRQWVSEAGLTIAEAKVFNTRLKPTWHVVPPAERTQFMRSWLDFELRINELDMPYTDRLASHFFTRNFVLAHSR